MGEPMWNPKRQEVLDSRNENNDILVSVPLVLEKQQL